MVAFFRKYLRSSPLQSVTTAAMIIASAGIVSRILGFVRDRILASQFGAGDVLDVYYASFRVPDMMFDLLVLGALSAAFIPIFTGLIAKDKRDEAWRVASGVLTLLITALGIISFFFFFFAPILVGFLVPGFDEAKVETTIAFTRIMLLSPILLGTSAVFGGILVSLKRFVFYAIAPIFYNIGIIIGVTFLVDTMGEVGLAWGVVLGASMHFAITLPAAIACGFDRIVCPITAIHNSNVRRVIVLMIPRAFGAAAQQFNMIAVTFFASLTTAGSLAVFVFANNIQSIPLGIIGIPFAVAAFPTLSTYFARRKNADFAKVVAKYIRRTIFLVLPLSMLLITLRAQVVRVVLGSGAFDWTDTRFTFQTLGILAFSLFAQSSIPLLARAFYAMHNTITPVMIAFVSVAVNIVTVIILLPTFGVYAIATGFAFASIVNFIFLFVLLEKKMKNNLLTQIHDAILRSLIAFVVASGIIFGIIGFLSMHFDMLPAPSFIVLAVGWIVIFVSSALVLRVESFFIHVPVATMMAAIIVQLTKYVIGTVTDLSTFWEVFIQLAVAGSLGIGTYLAVSYLLHIDEFFVLRAKVLSFIIRRNTRGDI